MYIFLTAEYRFITFYREYHHSLSMSRLGAAQTLNMNEFRNENQEPNYCTVICIPTELYKDSRIS
jgi:hypothetical protein